MPQDTLPLISVVIPVLNGSRYIKRCLDSVIGQELVGYGLEILVFDNNSSDNTIAIVNSIGDSRIVLHRSETTVSAVENWNRVSNLASGDYIKLLPADDVLMGNCLENQAGVLQAHSDVALVAASRQFVSDSGKQILPFMGRIPIAGYKSGAHVLAAILKSCRNLLGEPGAVMFRKTAFDGALPWLAVRPYVVDLDLYLRALRQGAFFGINDYQYQFRLTKGSWSSRLKNSQSEDLVDLLVTSYNVESLLGRWRINVKVRMFSTIRKIVSFFGNLRVADSNS